ncbi:DUF5908 family protein [Piscinibacter sp.]|uniref:DUF5908 family protein n=1 Tax=Piscinibacter sp. TaxID=1903157 RepID=UPI002B670864|nr:DUF5908 family protein [Albitalea sp.]HUG26169.1 DUF5908 family protein [Albitalea sp.]
MTIEVRQLVIKSQVGAAPPAPARDGVPLRELQRAREQILAECKAWLAERLQAAKER